MTALETTDTPAAALAAHVTIDSLDHVVLTVRDLDATLRFYAGMLGMRAESFGAGRAALHFGAQKLNLHVAGSDIAPSASAATPGSAALCFISRTPIEGLVRVLDAHEVAIEQGPVERIGATGPLLSVYVRDPDGNLVELANRLDQ